MANKNLRSGLRAGAASVELTPERSMFLFGYPHVPRWSTGVHDPLESAALYLETGPSRHLFIANDLIFVTKEMVREVRTRIHERTGLSPAAITVTATHTHSGPLTADHVSNSADPVVPPCDLSYVRWACQQMVEAGCRAIARAVPAEIALGRARAEGVGTNRHDPAGPADPDVPVLVVRQHEGPVIAAMLAYAMHTTVLHEDSKLISADFPYFTRRYLKEQGVVPRDSVIVYHNGASGNQSPRHVTRANTFAEAQRLGELLGRAVAGAFRGLEFTTDAHLETVTHEEELALRSLPAADEAERALTAARARFDALRHSPTAPRTAVRTAECDVFGAEETVALARAAADGRLERCARSCQPAEIQVVRLAGANFVFWPGEFFVEYALRVKAAVPNTFVITLANGELQGYIATPDAVRAGYYEARNAVFDASNGERIVERTLALLARGA